MVNKHNSLHLVENMLKYLSLDIICSSKLAVFLELRSWKSVLISEQIMSTPNRGYCLFMPQCLLYYFQASSSESTLVHYAQQQARREAESTAIRRQRNELEVALRDAEIR